MSLSQVLQSRNETTARLYADPHNPHLHLERGIQYEKLGFPDLASADAYHALSLLESVVDPDECEFHARRKVNPSQQGPEKEEKESDDEDEDDDTVPITQEEYDAIIDQVYLLLVRSLVCCGCYRDAFEFGVRGLSLLSCPASVAALNEQMDRVKQIYKYRTGSETENIDLKSIDPSVLPAQGFARRVLYPWNEHEPDRRSPETLKMLNERLAVIAPKCEVRAVALPVLHAPTGDSSSEDVSVQLGLFAKEDIAPDEIILRESSLLTATNRLHDDLCDACNAPLPELSAAEPPVACEGGCVDIIFCSQACHDKAQEIYHGAICGLEDGLDSIGKDVPDPKDKADYLYLLLLGRSLAMSATQDKHALELPEVKYIWGDFHDFDIESGSAGKETTNITDETATLPFSFQLNVLLPERFLDEMGLDPYTVLYRYDTWVLNTLYAKFRGTASGRLSTWDGGPELCAVHPLWCLANHSCDPNVTWEWSSEINFRARRGDETAVWSRGLEMKEPKLGGIAKDSEILNHYCDIGLPVQKRREWASGALGGTCLCDRCVWEAGEVE
ncbi:Tetratricopeptide-like helical [Penicillium sp. IBT 31633x]|nr:Tetratricopeptide-like helical [Penicillium sp. IBT 31633x]